MHIAIAATLFFAALTSGLGISRQIHGWQVYRTWHFLGSALVAAVMMIWFAYAAVWMYQHG